MPRPSIFHKALRDLRWQVFWYGLGLALMAALVVYIYPSYSDQLAGFDIPEALRPLVGELDFATPEGFIGAEFLSWVPIVLAVFAISSGTAALGGEEANGTMDLLLSQPLSRTRLAIEKLAALLVASLLIPLVTYAGWLISVPFVEIDVGLGELAVATLNLVPLLLMLQALACLAAVSMASRGLATGAVTAFAVASFFVNYVASLVEAIQPVRLFSVFHHYHGTEVLTEGVQWHGVALLLALYAACAVLVVAAFRKREIGSGSGVVRLPWPARRAPGAAA